MQLEQATPVANPDPTHYVVPTGFDQASVQAALDKVRMDTTGTLTGVYLPAGQYSVDAEVHRSTRRASTSSAPAPGSPSSSCRRPGEHGRRLVAAERCQRLDVPRLRLVRQLRPAASTARAHTWDLRDQSNITIDNVWIEHTVVGVWGAAGVTNSTFTNMRIRDTFADGINLTNGSTGNLISNDEARTHR